MDTKTLVVGQKVWMQSGRYAQQGRVIKLERKGWFFGGGVVVELLRAEGPTELKYLIRFNKKGRACDSRDVYEGNVWDGCVPGTHEFGPWELVG